MSGGNDCGAISGSGAAPTKRSSRLAVQAQAHADRNPRLRNLLALPLADRAADAADAGRFDEALTLYGAAIGRGQLAWVYHARGRLRHYLGDARGALDDYDRALEIEPWQASVHALRSGALLKLMRPDEGLAAIRLAAELEPANSEYAQSSAEIGHWLAELRRWEASKRNPNLPEAFEYALRWAWDHAVEGLVSALVTWAAWRIWLGTRRRMPAKAQPTRERRHPARSEPRAHPELPEVVAALLRAVLLVIVLIHVWQYGMHFSEADVVANGLDLPITAVALFGATAYAHGRRYFIREFWRVWAVLFPAWNVTYHFAFQGATLAEWPSWGFVHLEMLPVYVALFLYGFRASAMWEAAPGVGLVSEA